MTEPNAQHQERVQKLFETLWNDGKLGADIRAKAKELFPDVTLPEDTVRPVLEQFSTKTAALEAEVKEMKEREAAREKKEQEVRTEAQLRAAIDKAVGEYSLTDEGRQKMLERMKEQSSFDAEAAAAWVASKTPPPMKEPTFGSNSLNFWGSAEKDDRMANLHLNHEKYLDGELNEFLRNPEKYTRETLGI